MMQDLVAEWYALLSTLSAALTEPVRALGQALGAPLMSALLFGLLGAASPCQLTTTAGALACIARGEGGSREVAGRALAYALGKAFVYTLLGAAVILAGQGLARAAIPVIVVARQAVGPLMILLGLSMVGLAPLRFALGARLAGWLQARAGHGTGGVFLLGAAFAVIFCPTLFLLFFGLTIPLALASPVGLAYPAVFALGATLPLLGLTGLLVAGAGTVAGYRRGARRVGARLRPAAAAVLLLVGLHDTLIYWLLA
jgi:cytochrome c biogenesis protein CcdA